MTAQATAWRGRQRGALLGLAIGDALGAAVEFKPRGSFPPVIGYRSGGPHGLGPGEWTDDTSMALALADSMARLGWDLEDQARRYLAWWREGNTPSTGGASTSASRPAKRSRGLRPVPSPRPTAMPPTTRAATARSCGSRRCQSTISPSSPATWARSRATRRPRFTRRTAARNACRRAATSPWFLRR